MIFSQTEGPAGPAGPVGPVVPDDIFVFPKMIIACKKCREDFLEQLENGGELVIPTVNHTFTGLCCTHYSEIGVKYSCKVRFNNAQRKEIKKDLSRLCEMGLAKVHFMEFISFTMNES